MLKADVFLSCQSLIPFVCLTTCLFLASYSTFVHLVLTSIPIHTHLFSILIYQPIVHISIVKCPEWTPYPHSFHPSTPNTPQWKRIPVDDWHPRLSSLPLPLLQPFPRSSLNVSGQLDGSCCRCRWLSPVRRIAAVVPDTSPCESRPWNQLD